jgi:hypothetical protein
MRGEILQDKKFNASFERQAAAKLQRDHVHARPV